MKEVCAMIGQKSEHDRVVEIFDLANGEAKKLRAKNHHHELLRLLANPEDEAVWNEFQDRFGIKSIDCAQEYFWGQYYLALKNALGVGDDVCFTEDAIKKDAWVGKIDPVDVFKIIAVDNEGHVYLNGVVAYDNEKTEAAWISVDPNCLRKAT